MLRVAGMLILVQGLCLSPAAAQREAPKTPPTPRVLADAFFEKLKSGPPDQALELLLTESPLLEQPQQIELLKGQARMVIPVVGKVLGSEFIDEDTTGSALLRLKYLVRHEKDAMVWSIVFYKATDRWTVTALRWLPSVSCL